MDASFIVDLFRRDRGALDADYKLSLKRAAGEEMFLTAPAVFEVLTGFRTRPDPRKEALYLVWASRYEIASFDIGAAEQAAKIRSLFTRLGRTKGVTDVMIAGIALARGASLVTRDKGLIEIAGSLGLGIERY